MLWTFNYCMFAFGFFCHSVDAKIISILLDSFIMKQRAKIVEPIHQTTPYRATQQKWCVARETSEAAWFTVLNFSGRASMHNSSHHQRPTTTIHQFKCWVIPSKGRSSFVLFSSCCATREKKKTLGTVSLALTHTRGDIIDKLHNRQACSAPAIRALCYH